MSKNPLTAFALLISAFVAAIASSASDIDDKKIVGDLDTQYQLAVKNNDAKAMDRILADDFVLVTGRGQTFTKADLLKETRGNTVYEHQEDTNQVVHVWGDTAVVNALLWARARKRARRSITSYGSATPTSVRRPAGGMCSDRHRYRFARLRRPCAPLARSTTASWPATRCWRSCFDSDRGACVGRADSRARRAHGRVLRRVRISARPALGDEQFFRPAERPFIGIGLALLDDGETAGYAVLTVRFIMEHGGCDAFVDDLFVRSRHRRRGVGRDAMTALIGECKRRGVRCTLKSDPIMHRPTRFTAASALCRAATVASC